jgi:hypothetical protein
MLVETIERFIKFFEVYQQGFGVLELPDLKKIFFSQRQFKPADRAFLLFLFDDAAGGCYAFVASRVQRSIWAIHAMKQNPARLSVGKVFLNIVARFVLKLDPGFKSVIAFVSTNNKPSMMAVSSAGWQRAGRLSLASSDDQDSIIYEYAGG